MRRINVILVLFVMGLLCPIVTSAQIGYQVSLLNAKTGEPRANETVGVEVTITNSEDGVIYTGTQSATSNTLGVIQLMVGDQDIFKDVDWSKLPFFIEVSVDGTVIGKSQILTVPLAEAAKYLAPGIDIEDLVGTWSYGDDNYVRQIVFSKDGKGIRTEKKGDYVDSEDFTCDIEGKNIYICTNHELETLHYKNGALYGDVKYTKQ